MTMVAFDSCWGHLSSEKYTFLKENCTIPTIFCIPFYLFNALLQMPTIVNGNQSKTHQLIVECLKILKLFIKKNYIEKM